ncbi:MAG: hypothetical protein ACM3VW_01290 [Bacteroidota bacterium]
MDSLPTIPELIGLFLGVSMALALCTYLLYARGMSSGMSPRRIWRNLISIWVVVLGMLVFLFVVRALIGTPLVSGSATGAGLSFAHMTPAKWALLAVTIIIICTGALWLRKSVAAFEPPRGTDLLPPAEDATSDDPC